MVISETEVLQTNLAPNDGPPDVTTAAPVVQKPGPSLESLVQAVEPLARAYIESQKQTHARELDFQEKALVADGKRDRIIVLSAAGLAAVVLGMAGLLIFRGREDSAMDLIKLAAGVGGAVFGGYGLAVSRRRRADGDE